MFDHRQVLHRHDQKTMRLLIESYVRLVLHEHDMSESLPRGRPAGLVTGSLAVDAGGQMRRGQKEAVDFLSCVVRSIQGVLRLSLEQGKYLVLVSFSHASRNTVISLISLCTGITRTVNEAFRFCVALEESCL